MIELARRQIDLAEIHRLKRVPKVPGCMYCKVCEKHLPVSMFKLDGRSRFYCLEHLKIHEKKVRYTHPVKRAVVFLRQRAWNDLRWMGQERVGLSSQDMRNLLEEDQVQFCNDWAFVPRNPTAMMTTDNVMLVSNVKRRKLMEDWRREKDVERYTQTLQDESL